MISKFTARGAKLFFLFLFVFCFTFCGSIPNLEKPECTQSREAVREFYSFHFGSGDMRPSAEYLEKRERYLSDDLKHLVSENLNERRDYFTQTDDYPKAFRIGGCAVVLQGAKTDFGVVLFWKDDARSEQREVKVEMVKMGDRWLLNKVF